jgi:hypothetical protein
MKIDFTKEQFRELLLVYLIGQYVKDAVDELEDKYDYDKSRELELYLLEQAQEIGLSELVEHFHGKLIPADVLSEDYDNYVHEFEGDSFWHELSTQLGQRDFYREMTETDSKYIKDNNGWLPKRIHDYYERYENEFEKYGTERLEINEENKEA